MSFSPPQNLDRRLKEVNKFLQADSRVSANPIMKLMFGNPSLFLTSLPQNSLIHGSAVWSCREKVSLLSLTHIVEQNDGKDMLPVLWRFLHRVRKQWQDFKKLCQELDKKNVCNVSKRLGVMATTIIKYCLHYIKEHTFAPICAVHTLKDTTCRITNNVLPLYIYIIVFLLKDLWLHC